MQNRLSEIRSLNAEVVGISTLGGRTLEEKTRSTLNLTFGIIPGPNRKTAEAFGVWNSRRQNAIATVILDKGGVVRFIHDGVNDFDRPSASDVIKKLNEFNQLKQ